MRSKRHPLTAPEPGVYRGIPSEQYHQFDAVSASTLKQAGLNRFERCWSKVRFYLDEKLDLPTYAMYFGSAVHAALLESDTSAIVEVEKFKNPDTGRDNKIGPVTPPKTLIACQNAHPGQMIVGLGDLERIETMVAKAECHPRVGELLDLQSERELTLIWDDDLTGLRCKGRLDWWIPPGKEYRGILVDYKTTAAVTQRRFEGVVMDMGYYVSLSLYRRGIVALGLDSDPAIRIVSQEANAPHDVRLWFMDEWLEKIGDRQVTELLEGYAGCAESGHWPGFRTEDECIVAPLWMMEQFREITEQ